MTDALVTTLPSTGKLTPEELELFDSKWVENAETGCWEWRAGKTGDGYGALSLRGQVRYAHRVSYEHHTGQIPAGLVLDHFACQNPACIRPDHLEAVTQRVNLLRGDTIYAANAAKTRCPLGHSYSQENTGRTQNGQRYCRTCCRDKMRARRAAERRKAPAVEAGTSQVISPVREGDQID